jgi:hypothetical protein
MLEHHEEFGVGELEEDVPRAGLAEDLLRRHARHARVLPDGFAEHTRGDGCQQRSGGHLIALLDVGEEIARVRDVLGAHMLRQQRRRLQSEAVPLGEDRAPDAVSNGAGGSAGWSVERHVSMVLTVADGSGLGELPFPQGSGAPGASRHGTRGVETSRPKPGIASG